MRRLDEPLTFPVAAREIEWRADRGGGHKAAGRRLLRLVLKREQEIGRVFALRDRAGRPYKVTLGALTRYLPELRPSRVDTLAASVRPLVLEMDRRAHQIFDERFGDDVEPELQTLHNRDEEIASEVARLANAVARAIPGLEVGGKPDVGKPRGTTRRHSSPTG
jgi:hypothetical protein